MGEEREKERERGERKLYIVVSTVRVGFYAVVNMSTEFLSPALCFPVNPGPPAISPITWEEKKGNVLSKEDGWCIW